MERPTASLATYPETYEKEELERLMKPFAGAYNVEVTEMGQAGLGFDFRLAIEVASAVGPVIVPFAKGMMEEWGREFARWVGHFFKKSPENAKALIPLEIVSSAPKDYAARWRIFEVRVEPIRIQARDAQEENLSARLTNEFRMMDKALAEIWQTIRMERVPPELSSVTLYRDPVTDEYRFVRYEAVLFPRKGVASGR